MSKHPRPVDYCRIPQTMGAHEVASYERFREAHCDRPGANHKCVGVVTVDARGVTTRCPLCGDARGVYSTK